MGGGSKTKQTQSTSATQTTTNTDNSQTASDNATVIGSNANITINDLSADVAGAAIQMTGEVAQGAFELSKDTTGRAFDFLDTQAQQQGYEKIKNQELTASLATKSFDLAQEKTQAASDSVLNFGRVALYIMGGLVALFILFKVSAKKSTS